MTKEVEKQCTNQIVNSYLNKRYREKNIDEKDPLRMVVYDMIGRVMKGICFSIAKDAFKFCAYDYMIESQFIGLFNNYYVRRQVEEACQDAMEDLIVGEIIEDYCDRIVLEAVPIIASAELEAEIKRAERMEFAYAFREYLDRCILETVIENISKMYEDEEREIHYRE